MDINAVVVDLSELKYLDNDVIEVLKENGVGGDDVEITKRDTSTQYITGEVLLTFTEIVDITDSTDLKFVMQFGSAVLTE